MMQSFEKINQEANKDFFTSFRVFLPSRGYEFVLRKTAHKLVNSICEYVFVVGKFCIQIQ